MPSARTGASADVAAPAVPDSAVPGPDARQPVGSGTRRFDRATPWLVAGATLVARLATAAAGPTDWDSAQYAAGVLGFDVTHGRPQPPGYWLTILSGRAVHAVTGLGVVASLVLVSALASAAATGLTVVAGRDLGGRWVGLAAGAVVATSPFAWFSGSVVATYSFDLLAAPLLIILAWRARPHSLHGAAALGALGLLAGFRQSILQSLVLVAAIAVAGSVRRLREAAAAAGALVVAIAVWLVPMAAAQPGGLAAWVRATRTEASGAARATSVLLHASGGAVNVGTASATTAVALAPLAALALLAGLVLAGRAAVRAARRAPTTPDSEAPSAGGAITAEVSLGEGAPEGSEQPGGSGLPEGSGPQESTGGPGWRRPWYQSRAAVLAAATLPGVALVTLVQFAKGGYLLVYLPGAVIALLLVPARLCRLTRSRHRAAVAWTVVVSLAVAAVCALGAQRFLADPGVVPGGWVRTDTGPWFVQARYQAPYPETRAAIRTADAVDAGLARLGPLVRSDRDVVVLDTTDGGSQYYRNAGWELPADRVALIGPGHLLYNQQGRSLYYATGTTVAVGPGGVAYVVASPALPDLFRLTGTGAAAQVRRVRPIGGWLVFAVRPGSTILGVTVVEQRGPRPLGTGL